MNIQDLTRCYYILQEDIFKFKKLGLLDNVSTINGQMEFDDDDVRQIIEMVNLILSYICIKKNLDMKH